ncbi:hypothetical protein [Vulcanisaeta sp. JCM 14467]|uniref:hypothetical protein n=1 Tax=Vulcanisaeta sp. JCM 14467 TaxID=1295370 RepID=UPI0006D222C2|nr:hypothetical protein [Vulcanisaeta sp. JCM 14467]
MPSANNDPVTKSLEVLGNSREVIGPGVLPQILGEEERIKVLVDEAIRRLERFNADELWRKEMEEWSIIRERLRTSGFSELVKVVEEIERYIAYVRDWFMNHNGEVRMIIEALKSGKTVIMRGKRSLSVVINGVDIDLMIEEIDGGVIVMMTFERLGGLVIDVPKLLVGDAVALLKMGLELADGAPKRVSTAGARMVTANDWQVLLWMVLNYGSCSVRIIGVDLNKEEPKVKWNVVPEARSIKHLPASVLKSIILSMDLTQLKILLLGGILGDGSVKLQRYRGQYVYPVITLVFGEGKVWSVVAERLGLRPYSNRGKYVISINGAKAVRFARDVLNALPERVKDLLSALAIEKWARLMSIAEMHFRGRYQIDINGIAFSIRISKTGISLEHREVEKDRAVQIYKQLKNDYKVRLRRRKKGYYVVIRLSELSDEEVMKKIIRLLCMKYQEYRERGIYEKTRQSIINALKRRPLRSFIPIEGCCKPTPWITPP